MLAVWQQQRFKKKAIASKQTSNLKRPMTISTRAKSVTFEGSIISKGCIASNVFQKKRQKTPTPPLLQMKLIRPGKYKVKVITVMVESILSKKIRVAKDKR